MVQRLLNFPALPDIIPAVKSLFCVPEHPPFGEGVERSGGQERSAEYCEIQRIFPEIGTHIPLPSALRAATFPKGEGLRLRR